MALTPERMHAERTAYNKLLLPLYDFWVLWFSNRFVWQCPTGRLLQLYNDNASSNHLEAGVGTGYFLGNCRFAAMPSRLVIIDINRNCLSTSARRLARYSPVALQRDLLKPMAIPGPGFDSIGFNYVLHCLPGTMQAKASVFDRLKLLLRPGGVLFGATTLFGGIRKNMPARLLMALYNGIGIFANRGDSPGCLEKELTERFHDVRIEVAGCTALFVCR